MTLPTSSASVLSPPVSSFSAQYLKEVAAIAERLDTKEIESLAERLAETRERGGRLFVLGIGGGAAHASHAVNDFRKLCGLESYAPTDNVAELTARTNDEGWDSAYSEWLRGSRLGEKDAVLVFSVGGGSREAGISISLVEAIEYAKSAGSSVLGVVGREDGAAAVLADVCVIVGPTPPERLTPHVEEFQAVVWHLLVSHPALAMRSGTWESILAARVEDE
jgi:D-sedoheptulose 7-phosphate isomerase